MSGKACQPAVGLFFHSEHVCEIESVSGYKSTIYTACAMERLRELSTNATRASEISLLVRTRACDIHRCAFGAARSSNYGMVSETE